MLLDGHLNKKQIDKVLSIFWKAIPDLGRDQSDLSDDRLTIQSSSDLTYIWDHALKARATGVRIHYLFRVFYAHGNHGIWIDLNSSRRDLSLSSTETRRWNMMCG